MSEPGLDYRASGVDLEGAERAKDRLRALVESTRDEHTLSEMGLFGGLYALPDGFSSPVLVSSADGVGTKLKVAIRAGRHDTIGQDLVNHCVNDILVQGARPLFFLDYLALGVLDESVVTDVVAGVARGCRENRCALLGGETAQMPDFYRPGEYDLAGFIVGIVERDRVLDGSRIRAGDALVALGSSGLHTNGYTLARKIVFERMGLGVDDLLPELETPVSDALLTVHRSYLDALLPELDADSEPRANASPDTVPAVRGLAHITGGGIPGNLPRILPDGLGAVIERGSWEPPPLFRLLGEAGGVDDEEMFRVFNMGVGMLVVADPGEARDLVNRLHVAGEKAWVAGEVVPAGSPPAGAGSGAGRVRLV